MDFIVIEPDHAKFQKLARALDEEADGKEWARETAIELHAALEPGVSAVRSAVMGMGSGGLPHAGEPLRAAVATGVESIARFDGKRPGARIRAKKTGMPRGFNNAPARLNSRRGWRHPVFGNEESWVTQRGQPGWFDDTLRRMHPALRAAAERVLNNRAKRISRKAPG